MERGQIHLYYGDGKGKTTAAMGLALRAAGSGKRVVLVQFLKDGTSHEVQMLQKLPQVTALCGKVCAAFAWNMTAQQKQDTAALHTENLKKALALPCDVLILDEICAAVTLHLVDETLIKTLVCAKPAALELVLTGRDPADFMLQNADYATEMVLRKHPYETGLPAREGIEF
ncbi:MAG: cob(I)yrinic acid a,c-diamide adenosyltransferase [Ruthenibacterium sp.]